ncbi:penicillin-binding transpeptidase domain-containing protein [Luxibacter massiliensis]|uniref:penicillin-binding transpeptidase domain-containing protein n=1 Tax=Luxibacter massiliensis TaxID=2219695 RepID=UPI000F04547C|nr:penicillin-binding transpeptidase domain-containing protein [Luxibacter massiliensis]
MPSRKEYKKQKGRQGGKKFKWVLPVVLAVLIVLAAIGAFSVRTILKMRPAPEDSLKQYFSLLEKGEYEDMYNMLDAGTKQSVSQEDFINRNQNIYEGIRAANIKVQAKGEPKYQDGKKRVSLTYTSDMDTLAGKITFDNKMQLVKEDGQYCIVWDSTLIFPALKNEYKIQINTESAVRGSILDRNGQMLAGQGLVSEVGIVPGKLGEDADGAIRKAGEILDMTEDEIRQRLDASYVQEDSFVPLKAVAKNSTDVEEELLKIPGIMINDQEERVYPFGAAAGHLTGYVQSVTAEDLEELEGKGYHENSVIGKSGLELAYEEELRAIDGYSINIVDADGVNIETVALLPAQNGKDIQLTVDADVQNKAYEQFASDPGVAAAMNPKTGEVLALVSTPGFDPNEFVMGMSDKRWNELSNDENKPLMNRFYNTWVPGSTFKAVTAAIGLESGKLDPEANMGYVGLKWQKDGSWGDYFVTTLTDYGETVNLENALVYSDNIYFARAALDIGQDDLIQKFKTMGFEEEIPFELELAVSTYDDDDNIDSDIQLADTGYGQGQLLVNPVHMLSMYTMFVNSGDMVQPTLIYQESPQPVMWKKQVISPQTAETVKNDLIQVIENPSGTGAGARIEGITMLGKTGTAEIKESQDDTAGIERGWFICETTEDIEKPIVAAGMVEDVKEKGGSNYVTDKVREIVAAYEQ